MVDLSGEVSRFRFHRVDRAKLYGRKERVVLDENGEPCVSAYLTADGAALVPPGGSAHLYVDEHFDTIERAELVPIDEDGEVLETHPSTLGEAQELVPIGPERILDHRVVSVYQLDPEELGETLQRSLADGDLFETVYNYRGGVEHDALFLLGNDEGLFALVARPTGFAMIQRESLRLDEDDEETDGLGDDLDFSML